ncbi:DUF4932 domain-containing protein [Oceanirhabdus seepicola]|uniref:DUF4932 domain-containing protein n=1 Tax=Oceanirhabdus seepicola TaxID=2828781 RepID=A0A9J6P3A2_9CLOT|nr:DUF4932 domain-containing protein [Oceanirhabdus seepicola]MCM1991258.1 DUF4932 domain-containing protein [Oceanirhabdus seepicola]
MKNRKKYYLIGLVFILSIGVTTIFFRNNTKIEKEVSVNSEGIIVLKPIVQEVKGINISIDPRIELLSAVQLISDYDVRYGLITKEEFKYKKDMEDYFSKYSDHEVVKLFNGMTNFGFTFGEPPEAMLHLSNPMVIGKESDFEDSIIGSAGGDENLEKFISELNKFAVDTKFNEFYEKNKGFYNEVVEKTAMLVNQGDYIKDIENYYGMKQKSYNIILAPIFHHGGFGLNVKNEDAYDIYSIQGPRVTEKSMPVFGDTEYIRYIVWHEFSHSFIKHVFKDNLSEINDYSKLYTPISKSMNKQSYGNWESCVNEHVVRAVTTRLAYLNEGKEAYDKALNKEKGMEFLYVEALCEKLQEYENNRDRYKSFEEFYPELIKVFKELSEQDLGKDFYSFTGNIYKLFWMDENITIILPTNEEDQKIQNNIVKDVNSFFEKYKDKLGEQAEIITDKEALEKDLSDKNLIVFGTLEGNLWLKRYSKAFPFKIEEDKITADKVYKGNNVRFITSMPNPINKNKGMIIYTAQKAKSIIGINSVFIGPIDFVIAEDTKEINSGYYIKENGIWRFE